MVGGPVDSRHPQERQDLKISETKRIALRYAPLLRAEGVTSYTVTVPSLRLRAVVRRTDEGFVAEVPELRVLGYGEHLGEAVDDLQDAVRDYLTIVRDSGG